MTDNVTGEFLKEREVAQAETAATSVRRMLEEMGARAPAEGAPEAAGRAPAGDAPPGGTRQPPTAGGAPGAPEGASVRDQRRAELQTVSKAGSLIDDVAGGNRAAAVAADLGQGLIETPRAIFTGVNDAVNELAENVVGLVSSGSTALGGPSFSLDDLPADLAGVPMEFAFDRPESVTGGMIGKMTQFLAGFVPAMRAVKGLRLTKALGPAGHAVEATLAGAIADPAVIDEHEERLSNLVESFPTLQNPVTAYLAAGPEDGTAEAKFKQALEGLGLGAVTETLFAGVKAYRAMRQVADASPEAQQAKAVADVARAMDEASVEPQPLTRREFLILGDPDAPQFEVTPNVSARAGALLQEQGEGLDALLYEMRHPSTIQKPQGLLSWLKANGGLREDRGELAARGLGKSRPGLVSKSGRPLDDAARAAWEAGYIGKPGGERPTPDDLLAAIDEELRGRPVYREGDEAAARVQALDQLQSMLDELGIDEKTASNEEIKAALQRGAGDPLPPDVFSVERTRWARPQPTEFSAISTGDLAASMDEIPGWDDWAFSALDDLSVRRLRSLPDAEKIARIERLAEELAKDGYHLDALPDDMRVARVEGGEFVPAGASVSGPNPKIEELLALYIDAKGNRTLPAEQFNRIYAAAEARHPALASAPDLTIAPPANDLGLPSAELRALEAEAEAEGALGFAQPRTLDDLVAETAAAGDQGLVVPGRFALPGNRVANVNLNRIASSDDVMAVIRQMGEMMVEQGEIASTARQSTDVARDLANKVLADPDAVRKVMAGESASGRAFTREEIIATGMMLDQSAGSLRRLARKIATQGGTDADRLALRRMVAFHGDLMKVVSGQARETGRALQAFQTAVKGNKATAEAVRGLMQESGNTDALIRILASTTEPEQIAAAVKASEKPGIGEMFIEYWTNSILSGPLTHEVNIIGNALNGFQLVAERAVAPRLPGASGEIAKGEAAEMLFGLLEGSKDFFTAFGRAFKSGMPLDGTAKMDILKYRKISAANLGFDEGGMLGRAIDLAATGLRVPGRVLMSTDEAFKAWFGRAELRAQAYRQAVAREGLEGKAAAQRIAELLQDPTEDMLAAVSDFRALATFQQPLGPAGAMFSAGLNRLPVAKLAVPFLRTPTNIFKAAAQRTPLAWMLPSVKADLAAGGARRDLAVAKMTLGSLIMATAADYASRGYINGSGPVDPGERQALEGQGWVPYSMWVPGLNRWVAFNRLDPIGISMGIAADLSNILQVVDETGGLAANPRALEEAAQALLDRGWADDEVKAFITRLQQTSGGQVGVDDALAAAVVSVGNNVVSKSYLQGIAQLVEIFQSPSPEYGMARGGRFVSSFLASLVPFSSFFRQTSNMVDPYLRQTEGIVEVLKAMTPGLSKTLPPVPDLWGQPRMRATRFLPMANRKPVDSPADAERQRLGLSIRMPERAIGEVPLSGEEYARYVALAGNELKNPDTGLGMRETVEAILDGSYPDRGVVEDYQAATDGPDGGKALIFHRIVSMFREAARQEMLKPDGEFPEVAALNEELKRFKLESRSGDTIPRMR